MNNLTEVDKEYLENLVTKATLHSTGQIKIVVEDTMKKGFTAIGIDIDKPFEVQKDMSWVRTVRKFTESIITKGIAFLIATVTMAGMAWSFLFKNE